MEDTPLDQKRAGSWRSFLNLILPLLIAAGVLYVIVAPRTPWHRFQVLVLAIAICAYAAILISGRLRNALTIAASFLVALAAAEIYCVDTFVTQVNVNTPGHNVPHPILGWGPGHPGVFHHTKLDVKTGKAIWEVDYTVDEHLHRQVISTEEGPAIAFSGGSDTFGAGLPDSETLPQLFADATGRRLRVVNLGFPGYGPQQLLRGLETGLYERTLKNSRLLVIETTPWQAGRTACTNEYMALAPRYEMVGGQPTFRGTCGEGWSIAWRAMWEISSIPHFLVVRELNSPGSAIIDLYVATFVRAGAIAREKYGVPTVVLYVPGEDYLRPSGYTDEQLMQRLRDGGLAVVDGGLRAADFPEQHLQVPGDGHPTGVANRAWAEMLRRYVESLPPGALTQHPASEASR